MRKEVVEIISEMTIWGEMHKELKNEKMTPITEVDDFFFQLNKENERANIVRKEEKNSLWKYLLEYVLKLTTINGSYGQMEKEIIILFVVR